MKYVLVTGGYGGMGRKTCQELIKQGFVVFALDLKVEEKQDNLIPLQVDITNEESIVNAFNDVKKITDNLFAIIHFAGIYMLDSLFEIETKNFERIFNINLKNIIQIKKKNQRQNKNPEIFIQKHFVFIFPASELVLFP